MQFVDDDQDHSEPEGGWVTAPALLDTVITSITLCRFSGDRASVKTGCSVRAGGGHQDVECLSLYFQAEALTSGVIDQSLFPSAQEVVRTHGAGDDVVGTTH